MSFRIEGHGARLLVRIENDSHTAQQVLEAVHACRSLSWWSCPSGECARVADCHAHEEGGSTVLTMTSRAGESLSPAGVAECLRYVLGADATGAAH
ncbi:MAG TPA: hypothetical protein VK047_06840 [Zeimonas sp.]|jgi:hypothetical protein|nr:hypothetical protein [Zeimonas sp.]